MDQDGRLREDVISPLLKVSTFKGYTLTGPKEAIVRKVYSNQVVATTAANGAAHTGANQNEQGSFTQLNFRILGTSPTAMLNARVRLVVPLRFYAPNAAIGDNATILTAGNDSFDGIVVGPRRNGLLKAFSTISTIINNTTSFSVRPDECLAPAEQCFTQLREFGMTGVNNDEESGWWGPDFDGSGSIPTTQTNGYPSGGLTQLGLWEGYNSETKVNVAAAQRRADFIDSTVCTGWAREVIAEKRVIEYDYRSDLFVPPFKMFDYPTMSKSPTYIPYADQIEVAVHWKSLDEIKSALLLSKGRNQGASRYLEGYGLAYAGQPYLECEFIVPNFSIPPVVTLPCFRTIHYQHDVVWGQEIDSKSLREGTGVNNKQITMAPIRIESLPTAIFVWCSDTSIKADAGVGTVGGPAPVHGFQQREYNGLLKNFSCTLNERLRVLSDRSNYDLYKMFRGYCVNSRMSYKVWRELRQIIVFRSDILCTEASQSVFAPTTITFQMDVQRSINKRDNLQSKCTQRVHVLFWYGNEALSMSSQSSAVTSLLLNPSDVKTVRVSAGASAITEIMAKNQ